MFRCECGAVLSRYGRSDQSGSVGGELRGRRGSVSERRTLRRGYPPVNQRRGGATEEDPAALPAATDQQRLHGNRLSIFRTAIYLSSY